jgi:hypothetical protein
LLLCATTLQYASVRTYVPLLVLVTSNVTICCKMSSAEGLIPAGGAGDAGGRPAAGQ